MTTRAVFLDRDGVLMEDANYVGDVEKVTVIAGVPTALTRLRAANFKLFVITNQSGVGRGYFTREAVDQIHGYLATASVTPDRYYVCPHHPEDNCDCRKPKAKFFFDAAKEYGVDLSRSFMVGDRASDIQAGINAGVRTVLVLTGVGKETLAKNDVRPHHVAKDLAEATEWILQLHSTVT